MGASDNVRSSAFLFLELPTTSKAPLFYFWCFRQCQKLHFSIFGAFDNVRSSTFLFLVLSTTSEAPLSLFYFWCFRQCQKLHFSIFGTFDNVRSSTFLFPEGAIVLPDDCYPADKLLPDRFGQQLFLLILNGLIPSGNYNG